MSQPVVNLDFLLNDFVARCAPNVEHAIAVSSDGLLVAATRDLPVDRADQLAAFAAGLIGLVGGTDQHIGITAIEEENYFARRRWMSLKRIGSRASSHTSATSK